MFPPPAGQSCASAQIWPAVTGERGRQTNVEKKAWGSKGQSPSRFFPPFLGGKKWGAMRPELKRENQSSAAGRHGSKLCPGFRQHTGGPLMWVPLQKNSPPDCFSRTAVRRPVRHLTHNAQTKRPLPGDGSGRLLGGADSFIDEHSAEVYVSPLNADSISSSGMFSILSGFLLALMMRVK